MVYTPRISPHGSWFCMDFRYGNEYQTEQYKLHHDLYTEDYVRFMFDRELRFLRDYKDFSWCPNIEYIDYENQIIIFPNGWNFNHMMHKIDLNIGCPGWSDKIKNITQEQYDNGLLKLSVYPHSHMVFPNGKIVSFDFYACTKKEESLVDLETVKPLLGKSAFRFAEVENDGKIDIMAMYKNTLEKYHQWPGNIFEDFRW